VIHNGKEKEKQHGGSILMDIITIVVMLFLMAYLNAIQENRLMKAVFCIVMLYIGLMIQIAGITYGTTTIIATGSMEATAMFAVLVLGSLATAYAVAIAEPKGKGEE
jgi:quinol-cytochrome oxidoreductase complex cytochrome b subunit